MTYIATFFSHFGATRYERLCRAAGTINYEALCLVSKRVPRVAL